MWALDAVRSWCGRGKANLLEAGYDVHTVQELLGDKDRRTTVSYTHVLNRGGKGVRSR
jgi:site-specific recombinase XerD